MQMKDLMILLGVHTMLPLKSSIDLTVSKQTCGALVSSHTSYYVGADLSGPDPNQVFFGLY